MARGRRRVPCAASPVPKYAGWNPPLSKPESPPNPPPGRRPIQARIAAELAPSARMRGALWTRCSNRPTSTGRTRSSISPRTSRRWGWMSVAARLLFHGAGEEVAASLPAAERPLRHRARAEHLVARARHLAARRDARGAPRCVHALRQSACAQASFETHRPCVMPEHPWPHRALGAHRRRLAWLRVYAYLSGNSPRLLSKSGRGTGSGS